MKESKADVWLRSFLNKNLVFYLPSLFYIVLTVDQAWPTLSLAASLLRLVHLPPSMCFNLNHSSLHFWLRYPDESLQDTGMHTTTEILLIYFSKFAVAKLLYSVSPKLHRYVFIFTFAHIVSHTWNTIQFLWSSDSLSFIPQTL